MLTLTLHCTRVEVHPNEIKPPLVAMVTDVNADEVIGQIPVADIIRVVGAQVLLDGIGWKNVKQHFEI